MAGKQKTHRRFLAMGCKFFVRSIQPMIAKAQATALHSHGACFGVELMLATTGFIDDRRTLNQHQRRSTNYLRNLNR
jgi:hypothetical protein